MIENKKSNSKEALLQAAEKLFTIKGYAAVSTRELADEAEVNLGAIQYHFGSKTELFVETIRRLMLEKNKANPLFTNDAPVSKKEDAAIELVLFIRAFLSDLCKPTGPDACRLMYREVLGDSSQDAEMLETLVSLVVEEFIRPVDQRLRLILAKLSPESSEQELKLTVHSIIGQCSFYLTNRAFIERLRDIKITECKKFAEVSAHVASFTLRGLGLNDGEIMAALESAQGKFGEN
jgi:AcrR family transcriptional regulator